MATLTFTALFGDPKRTHKYNYVAAAASNAVRPAPFVYVDSASALGALSAFPLSTAITAGQKYAYTADTANLRCYWEVSVTGTSAGSQPTRSGTVDKEANIEVTSNTAKVKLRRHTGWARARTTVAAGCLPVASVTLGSLLDPFWNWCVLVASGHSQLVSTAFTLNFTQAGGIRINGPASWMVSVDKTPTVPVTMTAGASILGTGDCAGMTLASNQNAQGLVRGLKLGHDNTANTASGLFDQYVWTNNVRFYDCTFQSFRSNNATSAKDFAHLGGRHAMRCTYRSDHATTPTAVFGMADGQNVGSVIEAPTVVRLTTATAPLVKATDRPTTGGSGWPTAPASMFLLAADLSSFTGGQVFAAEAAGSATFRSGAAFRAFGSLFKAAPAYTTPTVSPMDITFDSENNVADGEYMAAVKPAGSAYSSAWESNTRGDNTAIETSLQRNSTFTKSGGASDSMGAFSFACLATDRLNYPFTLEFYNSKIDESFLITLEFQWSSTGTGLTTLKDEDIWLEAAFLDHATKNSATLVFSFDKEDRKGLIYNHPIGPAALGSSSATWAGGLASAIKQKVSVVVSPKKVGPIKLWFGTWFCPYTANTKTTSSLQLYVDPLPILSAAP